MEEKFIINCPKLKNHWFSYFYNRQSFFHYILISRSNFIKELLNTTCNEQVNKYTFNYIDILTNEH